MERKHWKAVFAITLILLAILGHAINQSLPEPIDIAVWFQQNIAPSIRLNVPTRTPRP